MTVDITLRVMDQNHHAERDVYDGCCIITHGDLDGVGRGKTNKLLDRTISSLGKCNVSSEAYEVVMIQTVSP